MHLIRNKMGIPSFVSNVIEKYSNKKKYPLIGIQPVEPQKAAEMLWNTILADPARKEALDDYIRTDSNLERLDTDWAAKSVLNFCFETQITDYDFHKALVETIYVPLNFRVHPDKEQEMIEALGQLVKKYAGDKHEKIR